MSTIDYRSIIDGLKSEINFDGKAVVSKDFDQKGVELLAPHHAKKLEAPLTHEQVKAADAIRKDQAVVAATAMAEVCQDQLVSNKDLASASGEFKIGNSTLKINVLRSAQVAAGIAKNKGDAVPTREVVGRVTKSVTTSFGSAMNKMVADIEERSKEVGLKG